MDGQTPLGDRLAIFERFRSGATRIVCNVAVLSTGVDEDVRCIIDAKPTKSPILFVQTIGRGLRTADGKDHLLILDHAGNRGNSPIGALAHLGLGRAYALSGDTAKARAEYQDFLALWKDADPDVPILKQARVEYSRLN